ncbi:MAG: methylenetetrahydrofolate reductase [NAD(P)H] [Oscillospiraceae bacterium]|nr:methylenetetrahydrofolate reductase [NAD(P)H] [Oscillospiraceae bacterium]
MKLSEKFTGQKCILSFEVFPPKKSANADTIYTTLAGLKKLSPAFISVTYGAGGTSGDNITGKIASHIKHDLGIDSAAHLTCVSNTKEDIDIILGDLKANGIDNILALRGDTNPERPPKNDFHYASELIEYIKSKDDSFGISAGCYPECHPECDSIDADIDNLKRKVDAGAEHLMSQLFFDNEHFYGFLEKARAKGINVPIEAGIMPVVNKNQIERMVSMCGASLPSKFSRMMARYESDPDSLREAGIAYAIDQIIDLISSGVDGIHLYTMNNTYVAGKISDTVNGLL